MRKMKDDRLDYLRELNNTKAFFNQKAEDWDEKIYHDLEKLDIIIRELDIKPTDKILDVGTGTGIMIPYLYEQIKDPGKIIAVDISENMIRIARAKHPKSKFPNVDFLVQDIYNHHFEEKFDVILCYSCFPHFIKQRETIKKLARRLNNGGKLMIAHSQSRDAINNLHKECDKVISKDKLPPILEIVKIMEDSGFKVQKKVDNEEMFYILGRIYH